MIGFEGSESMGIMFFWCYDVVWRKEQYMQSAGRNLDFFHLVIQMAFLRIRYPHLPFLKDHGT